jgi:hypothetical protein
MVSTASLALISIHFLEPQTPGLGQVSGNLPPLINIVLIGTVSHLIFSWGV